MAGSRYNGRRSYRQARPAGELVSPRQAAALDRMADAHGFASGSALLASVASCSVEELARKSRSTVQMFIDQTFARYGRQAQPAPRGAHDLPAGASAWAFANAEAGSMAPRQAPAGADLRAVSRRAGSRYGYTSTGARVTMSSARCEDAPCCGCCD